MRSRQFLHSLAVLNATLLLAAGARAMEAPSQAGSSISTHLQEIRTAADLQRRSDLLHLEEEIAVRIKMRKARTFRRCSSPTVEAVFPTEAHPGDPILIEGCGFRAKQGSQIVTLLGSALPNPPFAELQVESWSETIIKGRIPSQLSQPLLSLARLTPSVLRHRYATNRHLEKAAPRIFFSLKPELEIRGLNLGAITVSLGVPPEYSNHCFSFKDYVPLFVPVNGIQESAPKILHFSPYWVSFDPQGGRCAGKDAILLQNIHLASYWTFYQYQFYYECMSFSPQNPTYVGYCQQNWAKLDQDLGDIRGKTALPNVTVTWDHFKQQGVAYTLMILIEGPKGTFT